MRPTAAKLLCLALGLLAVFPASAIFKCDAGGKVSYSDTPCDGGKTLDLKTAPVSGDGEDSRQAAREKAALKSLERERHKREAAEQRGLRKAGRESAARHRKCATHARRLRIANQEVSRTAGLANEKAKRKAQQITEEYEADCGRWYERELSLAR